MNNCDTKNINIKSNFLDFDRNGIVIGFKDKVITSYNKYQFAFKRDDKDFVILIGDEISDIMMLMDI